MSARRFMSAVLPAIVGFGLLSAIGSGYASAKTSKINASNYGVLCTGQTGDTTFSPPLKIPGTNSGKVALELDATLTGCTATPPSGGPSISITQGVVSGTLRGSKGTSCLESIQNGGSLPFKGILKVTWTSSPKLKSATTKVQVKSGSIGFTGTGGSAGEVDTLTFPGSASGNVTGSFSTDQANSFSYSVTNETVQDFVTACESANGLSSVSDSGGFTDFGMPPTSISVTQTPSDVSSIPLVDNAAYDAVATYPGSNSSDVTSRATWSSSDQSIANFGANSSFGPESLNLVAPGTTEISASLDGVTSNQVSLSVLRNLSVVTTVLPDGQGGQPYDEFVTAKGGYGAYSWTELNFPPGLTLNPSTGEITGTPDAGFAGSYPDAFVKVTDSYPNGADVADGLVPITIDP